MKEILKRVVHKQNPEWRLVGEDGALKLKRDRKAERARAAAVMAAPSVKRERARKARREAERAALRGGEHRARVDYGRVPREANRG